MEQTRSMLVNQYIGVRKSIRLLKALEEEYSNKIQEHDKAHKKGSLFNKNKFKEE